MKLIVLEGLDGSGKSTIWENLKEEFKSSPNVEFIKTPLPPFTGLIKDFWNGDTFERFIFFLSANSYFIKTIKPNITYVLDRFMYSTLITHLNTSGPEDSLLMVNIAKRMNIPKPTVTFLIQASYEEIERRLALRNNEIDNALNLEALYKSYYQSPFFFDYWDLFGEIRTVWNNTPQDLIKAVTEVSKEIY